MFLPRNGQRIGSVSTHESLLLADQLLATMPYHENEHRAVEFPHDWLIFCVQTIAGNSLATPALDR